MWHENEKRPTIYAATLEACTMRIPEKYSNLLFGALLSTIMVTIISGAVIVVNHGLTPELPKLWLKGFATAWPIAFPSVLVIAPRVRRVVERMTENVTR